MIRLSASFASVRLASIVSMVCLSLPAIQVAAQQQVSPSPAQEPSASTSAEPAIAPVFSKPDPANFTATLGCGRPSISTIRTTISSLSSAFFNAITCIRGLLTVTIEKLLPSDPGCLADSKAINGWLSR